MHGPIASLTKVWLLPRKQVILLPDPMAQGGFWTSLWSGLLGWSIVRCDLTICKSHQIRNQLFLFLCLKVLTQDLEGGNGSQPVRVSILTISDVPGIGLDSCGCNQVLQSCPGHDRQDTPIRKRPVIPVLSPIGDEMCRNRLYSYVPPLTPAFTAWAGFSLAFPVTMQWFQKNHQM